MPPSVALAPGSIGKKRPVSRRWAFSVSRVTPGCTTASRSSAWTASTRSMPVRSSAMPPRIARWCPSSEERAPCATTGMPAAWQSARSRETSSVEAGRATASGRAAGYQASFSACCARTASEVRSRSPRRSRSAGIGSRGAGPGRVMGFSRERFRPRTRPEPAGRVNGGRRPVEGVSRAGPCRTGLISRCAKCRASRDRSGAKGHPLSRSRFVIRDEPRPGRAAPAPLPLPAREGMLEASDRRPQR